VIYLSKFMISSAPSLYCAEAGGMAMPNTALGYGSSYPYDTGSGLRANLWVGYFTGDAPLLCAPILEGFLRKRFERGLSIVDADEPEIKEGVRAGSKRAIRDTAESLACACWELFGILVEVGSLRGAISRRNSSPTTLLTPLFEGARLTFCCDGTWSLWLIGFLFTSLVGAIALLVGGCSVGGRAGRRLEGVRWV